MQDKDKYLRWKFLPEATNNIAAIDAFLFLMLLPARSFLSRNDWVLFIRFKFISKWNATWQQG